MQARYTLCVGKGFGAYSLFEVQVYTDILSLVAELPDEVWDVRRSSHETRRIKLNSWATKKDKAPVIQTLDSAIHRINPYPADKYLGNQLRYPVDRFLSRG